VLRRLLRFPYNARFCGAPPSSHPFPPFSIRISPTNIPRDCPHRLSKNGNHRKFQRLSYPCTSALIRVNPRPPPTPSTSRGENDKRAELSDPTLFIMFSVKQEARNLFTLYSLLFTLYSLLFTLYSLLFTLYSLLFTLYSLLFTLYSLLFTLYSKLPSTSFLLKYSAVRVNPS
jgi:hypothetical protein